MKYNIDILSRHECILLSTRDLDEDCIIISINNSGEKTHIFDNPHIKDVLALTFDDITLEFVNKGSKGKLMELSDTEKIKEFIDTYKNTITNIYIHCTMGISRSGAVGCVLSRHLNNDDMYLFRTGKYLPNEYVYELMCNTFGLTFDKKEFKRKKQISSKKCHENLKGYGDFGINLDDMFGGKSNE